MTTTTRRGTLLCKNTLAAITGILIGVVNLSAPLAAASAPECLQKAAFWVDDSSLVNDGAGGVAQWRDVRETGGETPMRYYAVPAWTNATTFASVNPAIESIGEPARTAVNFNGRSGQYLRFMKGGTKVRLNGIRHLFAVHCPSNWFPSIIGEAEENRTGAMFVRPSSGPTSYILSLADGFPLFWHRVDLGTIAYTSVSLKVLVNGEEIDPYSYRPKAGFQTFEMEYTSPDHAGRAQAFFFQRYETGDSSKENLAGGDWVSEVVVFTNQLSQTEIAAVRSYLNGKWEFPLWRNHVTKDSDATGTLSGETWTPKRDWLEYNAMPQNTTSRGAGTIDVAAGETAGPFMFEGTGAITKTGAGTLVVGPSGPTPFAGTLDLQAGDVLLRGGAPLPVEARAGTTLTVSNWVPTNAPAGETWHTPDFHGAGGVRMTLVSGAGGTFTKAGDGAARVRSVAANVGRIAVEGGELALGAAASCVDTFAPVTATVPNADIEEAVDPSLYYNKYNQIFKSGATINGWTITGGGSMLRLWPDVTYNGENTGYNYRTWTPCDPLDGKQCLMLKNVSSLRTTITFPEAGIYVLEMDVTGRRNLENHHLALVEMGPSVETLARVSSFIAPYGLWKRIRVRLPYVEAGNQVLRFRVAADANDDSTMIDNIKITRVHAHPRQVCPIPNGDFENVTSALPAANYRRVLSRETGAEGWTLNVPATLGCVTNPPVAIVTPITSVASDTAGNRTIPHGTRMVPENGYGVSCLMFAGNTGSASTTFTPTAGTWHLRLKMSRILSYFKVGLASSNTAFYNPDYAATLTASVQMAGGETVSLGTVTTGTKDIPLMGAYTFPNAFTADGSRAATLVLSNTVANVACYVDDLELAQSAYACEDYDELVSDGDFELAKDYPAGRGEFPSVDETASPWTNFYRDSSLRHYNASRSTAYINWPNHYGYTVYHGARYFRVQNVGGKYQSVNFPSAGLYRLRLALRSRTDYDGYARNDIHCWLDLGGGRTNSIAHVITPAIYNFTEYEYLFRIDEPGTYRFGIEGLGQRGAAWSGEGTTAIDGVSIRKVGWDVPEAVEMPKKVKVEVAQGAYLNLAFTGTNTVASLNLGGESVMDFANATTHPEFICGMGTLVVRPTGTMMLFR